MRDYDVHCATCSCSPPPTPLVVNRDAPFYPLVLEVDRYAWERTHPTTTRSVNA